MATASLQNKIYFIAVLLGNEFDINVGLKKRKKRNLDEPVGAELIFQRILQAISDLKISNDEIHFKKTNSEDNVEEKSEGKIEEKSEKDLTVAESEFSSLESNSLETKILPKQKWFYAEKFKNPNEENNFELF